jgi:hypothetical protein
MKKGVIFFVIGIFLMSLISSLPNNSSQNTTSQKIESPMNSSTNSTQNQTLSEKRTLIQNQETLKNRIKQQNRIQIGNLSENCPENCSCQGAVIQCQIQNGRQIQILAGNSGKTILKTKEKNISTSANLYTENGKMYMETLDGNIKSINLMPEQISEKLEQNLKVKLEEEMEIELDEEGKYQVEIKKQTRFLGMIKIQEKVRAEFDSETGELIQTKNSWWSFLSKDIKSEPLLGSSCGTVSPDSVDECCNNKGYDFWNNEKQECAFLV